MFYFPVLNGSQDRHTSSDLHLKQPPLAVAMASGRAASYKSSSDRYRSTHCRAHQAATQAALAAKTATVGKGRWLEKQGFPPHLLPAAASAPWPPPGLCFTHALCFCMLKIESQQ